MTAEQEAAQDQEALERPDNWGGYLIRAREVELWMGQPNRLHDRILFRKEGQSWTHQRLAP